MNTVTPAPTPNWHTRLRLYGPSALHRIALRATGRTHVQVVLPYSLASQPMSKRSCIRGADAETCRQPGSLDYRHGVQEAVVHGLEWVLRVRLEVKPLPQTCPRLYMHAPRR
jgi:hypothetical protein